MHFDRLLVVGVVVDIVVVVVDIVAVVVDIVVVIIIIVDFRPAKFVLRLFPVAAAAPTTLDSFPFGSLYLFLLLCIISS